MPVGPRSDLWPGEGDDVEELGLHVDRDLAGRLRRVDGEGDARLAAKPADRGDGLDRTDDVRSVVDDDQAGVGAESLADLLGIDEAGPVEGHEVDGHAVAPEVVERPQDGVVLEGRRDGMIARLEQARDDEVEGVGRVVAEAEPVRIGPVEERREELAGVLDDEPGLHAEVVAGASGIDAEVPVEVVHVGVDLFGLGEGCRPVVEEDQLAHALAPR